MKGDENGEPSMLILWHEVLSASAECSSQSGSKMVFDEEKKKLSETVLLQ